jgi:hypothetical protein
VEEVNDETQSVTPVGKPVVGAELQRLVINDKFSLLYRRRPNGRVCARDRESESELLKKTRRGRGATESVRQGLGDAATRS